MLLLSELQSNQQCASVMLKYVFDIQQSTNKNMKWQGAAGLKEKEVIINSSGGFLFVCLSIKSENKTQGSFYAHWSKIPSFFQR